MTKTEKEISRIGEVVSDLIQQRDELRTRCQANYTLAKSYADQLKEAKIAVKMGDKPESPIDDLEARLESCLQAETDDRKELILVEESLRRSREKHNALKQQHRRDVREKLIANTDDLETVRQEMVDVCVKYLVTLEAAKGLSMTAVNNIGNLIQQALLNEGMMSSPGGSNRGVFMQKLSVYRETLLGAAA